MASSSSLFSPFSLPTFFSLYFMFVTTFLFIFFTRTKSQYRTIGYCIHHYHHVFHYLILIMLYTQFYTIFFSTFCIMFMAILLLSLLAYLLFTVFIFFFLFTFITILWLSSPPSFLFTFFAISSNSFTVSYPFRLYSCPSVSSFFHHLFLFYFIVFAILFFSFTFRNISLHPFSNILTFLLTFTVCSCRIQHLASIPRARRLNPPQRLYLLYMLCSSFSIPEHSSFIVHLLRWAGGLFLF